VAESQVQPARGMRDFLPLDVLRRKYVIDIVEKTYRRYGFEPLETPAVEKLETLMGKYGEEGNQLIFKILRRGVHEGSGEADLALRYDLTVPLARVVACYADQLPKFFKRYQIQPVWRADRPARGRFREFYQCDIDALGSISTIVETELCAAATEVLKQLGFRDFAIRINHRNLLTGILNSASVPVEKHADALVALDKLDKIGPEGVKKEFQSRSIDESSGQMLLSLFATCQSLSSAAKIVSEDVSERAALNRALLGRLVEFTAHSEVGARGIEDLRTILDYSRSAGIEDQLLIDPSLARGLSYYTGTIMEISVSDLPGSLGGGGRYDNLVGMFLGRDIPACGFSLGLERIIVVMNERGMFPQEIGSSHSDVMITIFDEQSVAGCIELAQELRAEGLSVNLYPEADKLKKQLKYASTLDVPAVIIYGPDEQKASELTIKNMVSGEQVKIKKESAASYIKTIKE
jgi:histidyl-tRNA synthetase